MIFKQINAGHVLILTGPGPTASDSNFQTDDYVLEPTVPVSAAGHLPYHGVTSPIYRVYH